jgi:hypothetical protein
MAKRPSVSKILVDDDASRFIDKLSPRERWPEYDVNKLPEEGTPLSDPERMAAKRVWANKIEE